MGFAEFCSAYLVEILLFAGSVFTGIYAGLAINEIRKKIKARKNKEDVGADVTPSNDTGDFG